MDLLTLRFPNRVLPPHTQKQCTAGDPSLSLTTKGSWIQLGREGRQASRQPSDASTLLKSEVIGPES